MSIPRCPRFVCGEIDFEFEFPTRPHLPRRGGVGGSETAAGGIPASYSIRRDHLLSVPLRFTEEDWPEVEALIDEMMTSAAVEFYRDADDEAPTNTCYLESPKEGEEWGPDRTDEMAGEFEMTIVLRSITGPWDGIFLSDVLEES